MTITWTPRQRAIAPLLTADKTYAEIGLALGISPATVRVHVNAMAARLPDDPDVPARRRVERYLDAALHHAGVYTPADAPATRSA